MAKAYEAASAFIQQSVKNRLPEIGGAVMSNCSFHISLPGPGRNNQALGNPKNDDQVARAFI
jgi:hypothetical protein